MVQKRSFVEDLCEVSRKHPRQLRHNSQLVSFLELPSEDVAYNKPHTSGEGEGLFMKTMNEHCDKFGRGNSSTVRQPCTKEFFENGLPGCNSNSSWASSSTSEEDIRLEVPFHLLFSSEYCNYDIPRRTVVQREDTFSTLLERSPQKQVSVGPDFQALIPEWCGQEVYQTFNCLDSSEASIHSPRASKPHLFAGTCVVPMPEVDPSTCIGDKVGDGRTNCCCEDLGSVRCVRQHIIESREKLRRSLGEERFVELGFNEMGEVVGERWSKEDEQLFHEVVFSNPASLGKNFWDHLSVIFPFRTKKEIVSYYFNVFVLRRRAEQNRCSPMDIDSDNDEWQGSDDEVEMSEEDEDSVIESPAYHDNLDQNEIHEDDSCEYYEHNRHITSDYPSSDPVFRSEKTPFAERGDGDLQGDSCTSSDTVVVPQGSQLSAENGRRWSGTFSGTSGGGDRGFALEACDAKEWDVGYLTRGRNEVDFLPTCSMIEEVFGVGSWDCDDRDGEGLS
ncbi:hypothetical protein LguiA_009637 [Lonicera macranthoides]